MRNLIVVGYYRDSACSFGIQKAASSENTICCIILHVYFVVSPGIPTSYIYLISYNNFVVILAPAFQDPK